MGAHDQRADSTCALHHEDQSRGSSREKVLGVDRWVDPVVFVHFPADVDFEGGVRRVWSNNRAPQVLLICLFASFVHNSGVSNGSVQSSRQCKVTRPLCLLVYFLHVLQKWQLVSPNRNQSQTDE